MAQIPQGKKIYKEYSVTLPNLKDVIAIGKYIWVLTTTSVKVYAYYNYTNTYDITQSEYLLEDIDKDLYLNNIPKLIEIATFNIGGNYFTYSGTSVYVISSTQIREIEIDSLTLSPDIGNIILNDGVNTFETNSEIVYADEALWVCDKWAENKSPDTHDYLWKYNLTTKIWSRFSVLHGRQLARRKMCNGKNGNLYISNWNTGDVIKVSTLVPNVYLALRTDYTPDMIMFDERADKILVHTGKDKIVAINRQTDEAVVILNTMGICTAISERTSDNAYWFVSEDFTTKMNIDKTTMLRTKKKIKKPIDTSTNPQVQMLLVNNSLGLESEVGVDFSANIPFPSNDSSLNAALNFQKQDLPEVILHYDEVDYSFTLNVNWLKEVTKILVIPEHTIINHNNGQPLLIHEYILALVENTLYMFRNKNNYYEENYVEITGQGMVYSGNDFYTGESI